MPMFKSSSNLLITGGTFIDKSSNGLSAIHYLYREITSSAIHDSEERYDPPKCHPKTRTAIIGNILGWIKDPQKQRKVLRLHGPAGAGKSAISQTIAEMCQECSLLAATFFFSRDRNTGKRLFATLAYQLATNIPALKEKIEEVIEAHPQLVAKSMEVQLKKLILQPLAQVGSSLESAPQCVIIIDGLDECSGDKQQADILEFIFFALQQPYFPFCFIIASRPEPRIVACLDSTQHRDKCWSINLNNRRDAKEDIRIVLRSGFAEIHDNPIHPSMATVPKPWPTDFAIEKIVARSSGQFVYASTVLKFIDDPEYEPTQQLQIILAITQRSHPNAFSDLDKLYSEILSRCRNPERMLDVLGYLIALIQGADAYAAMWGRSLGTTNLPTILDQLLSLNPGDSERSLRGLHSLISVFTPTHAGSETSGIKFHHASFADFLRSEKRAGRFFIKVSAVHGKITRSCLRILRDFPPKNVTHDGYCKCLAENNLVSADSL
ncbi:hypothetical protein M413DRAFT_279410 [Hebeloma cylindrosporum]|uniref:Nephrocystin 3-like N-terminal domain-containing protein n=1 Tax=Hebeloma cylindrosporum TaxID=76867 RepID=A0A0C3C0M1_HEBCY|nr:hypothetical protein M413DRAFT_279410 [Hebeloma cylindrosporum h7]